MTSTSSQAGSLGDRPAFVESQIKQDAVDPAHGAIESEVDKAMKGPASYKFIEYLWNHKSNTDVVQKFMENPITNAWAQGIDKNPQLKNEFLVYCIQDYLYLLDYIKFKALRLVSIPQTDLTALREEARSIGNQFENNVDWWMNANIVPLATELFKDLANLQEKERIEKVRTDVLATDRSVAELAYANFLQNNASHDDWFNMHVIMIACTYVRIKSLGLGTPLNDLRVGPSWPSSCTMTTTAS